MMSASVEISEATAKSLLGDWLHAHDSRLMAHISWTRVTFTERHYWAGVVHIWGEIGFGRFGFHVYDSGEVALICRMNDAG